MRDNSSSSPAKSEPSKKAPDVVLHDFSSLTGHVFTVGDIHGATAFSDLVEKLKENDKVVLVGDLMDRGEDTYKNLEIIIKDKRFLAVRGNHEEMFLKYVNVLKNKKIDQQEELKKFLTDNIEKFSCISDPNAFATAKKKLVGEEKLHLTLDEAEKILSFIRNGGDWALKQTQEELEKIEEYINNLPYILKITPPNKNPFLVCHADMSFLPDKKVKDGLILNEKEKHHITWARENELTLYQKRTKDSVTVYCGHNITTKKGEEVVRKDTNHVNLDFGAFAGVPLVGVEHPNKAMVFGKFTQEEGESDLEFQEKQNNFFNQLFKLHKWMGEIEFTDQKTKDNYNRYNENKKQVKNDLEKWYGRHTDINNPANSPYLKASDQVENDKKIVNPTSADKLTALIHRLDKKLAEYKIRLSQGYKTDEAERKRNEAQLMRLYFISIKTPLSEKKKLPDIIKNMENKKWGGMTISHTNGIPPRPKHTFGSELIKIHDDFKEIVRDITKQELDDARQEKEKMQKLLKKNKSDVNKLNVILADLKIREIEYARRVAVGDLYSITFFSKEFGVSAKDKLTATRDLIKHCGDLIKHLNEGGALQPLQFTSDAASNAANQGTLNKECYKIICEIESKLKKAVPSSSASTAQPR